MHASDVGFIALVLAMTAATYAVGASVLGYRRGILELVASARNAVLVVVGAMAIASGTLIYSFWTHDFGVEFVARTSSREQPWYYNLSAFYGGQAGSLLLWATGLAIFSGICVWINRRRYPALMPYVTGTLMTIQVFFLVVLVFLSNPFERLAIPLADGQGLNPLLRDPGMMLHPPFLLLGYMSWSLPFAFAMAALITGNLDSQWIKAVRPWILAAFTIQGVGLLLGAWWAYHVLGWGGYWGWDPVENVALLPWLVGTAFLHSVMVQRKRGMLKAWNLLLLIIAFVLSLFGTLVVRGGLLASVHNFAGSALGPAFLAFMGLALIAGVWLLVRGIPLMRSGERFESFLSRDVAILLMNLLLIGVAFATFWGTIFPLLTEALNGSRITVGPPYYHKVNGPILLALLAVMGFGPLLTWRGTTRESMKHDFALPLAAAIAWVIAMATLMRITNGWTLLGVGICAFILGTIVLDYFRGVRLRRKNAHEPYHRALTTLVARDRRRYGGYIVHFAIVLIALGAIGSNLHQTAREITLVPGQSARVGAYTLTFQGMKQLVNADSRTDESHIDVSRNGKLVAVMKPRTVRYTNFESQPASKIAIRSTPIEDIYIFQAAFDNTMATFTVFINPLVIWVWIGGVVFLFGVLIVAWPEREPVRATVPIPVQKAVLDGA